MSAYQYYEFTAIDWSLNESEDYGRFDMEAGSGRMGRLLPLRDELLPARYFASTRSCAAPLAALGLIELFHYELHTTVISDRWQAALNRGNVSAQRAFPAACHARRLDMDHSIYMQCALRDIFSCATSQNLKESFHEYGSSKYNGWPKRLCSMDTQYECATGAGRRI